MGKAKIHWVWWRNVDTSGRFRIGIANAQFSVISSFAIHSKKIEDFQKINCVKF